MNAKLSIGSVIGDWTIIKSPESWYGPYGRINYTTLCRCKCGATQNVNTYSLERGTSRGCRSCALKRARTARKIHNFTVIYNGEHMMIDDAIRASGTDLDYKTIRGRMKYGMTFEEVVKK